MNKLKCNVIFRNIKVFVSPINKMKTKRKQNNDFATINPFLTKLLHTRTTFCNYQDLFSE